MSGTRVFFYFLFLSFFFTGNLCGAEGLSREQTLDHMYEGNTLFRDATEYSKEDPSRAKELYRKAAMYFERIVYEGGIHNGKLFYNIGNAYFKAGELGKAILYYKRGLTLIPNNINLKNNLDYARSQREDKIEEKEQTRILRVFFFWHYELSPEIRFILFISFFFIIWITASLLLFMKSPALKWGVIIPAVFAFLFLGSLVVDVIDDSINNHGVILAHEVVARKGDSEAYEPSFLKPLHEGTEFTLIEKRRGWYNIKLIDGSSCWVPEKDAGLVKFTKGG